MGFSCGIVGLPNVGKSTIFNALTRSSVPAENYPFCTIEPNVGVVPVPDSRLDTLAKLVPKEKVVPTVMRFVDIAGLVKGSSKGEGLGNQFLGQIAEVEAIAHVVRCFEDPKVVHTYGSVDPKRDIEIVQTELLLKDLEIMTPALDRLRKVAKSGDKKAAAGVEVLQKIADALNRGAPARTATDGLAPTDREGMKDINLLTTKPTLYVANVGEKEAVDGNSPAIEAVRQIALTQGSEVVVICGALEAQIAALESDEERAEYLAAVGLKEPGLNQLIRAGYKTLGRITFFTMVGTKELRAWTIRRGSTAVEAAGKIHTDMARGFIRAEVIAYDDFVACGSEQAAKEQGKLRLEGKEYVVQDGEILHFRFNV